jgi:hypothetical protein
MRKQQRRVSAREWIRSGANVTMKTYTKRYGVDRYTAYDDLTFLGFTLPTSAQQWAQRPPPIPPRANKKTTSDVDTDWIMLDGRSFFVVGYTPGGAPYGMFEDEMRPEGLPNPASVCPAEALFAPDHAAGEPGLRTSGERHGRCPPPPDGDRPAP